MTHRLDHHLFPADPAKIPPHWTSGLAWCQGRYISKHLAVRNLGSHACDASLVPTSPSSASECEPDSRPASFMIASTAASVSPSSRSSPARHHSLQTSPPEGHHKGLYNCLLHITLKLPGSSLPCSLLQIPTVQNFHPLVSVSLASL